VFLVVQCCVKRTVIESNILVFQVTLYSLCLERNSEMNSCSAVLYIMCCGRELAINYCIMQLGSVSNHVLKPAIKK